jgi:hypothetical protein
MAEPICDFCSSPEVAWSYECPTFTPIAMPGVFVGESIGDWAACESCAAKIEDGEWEQLAVTSANTFKQAHPMETLAAPRGLIVAMMSGVQAGFRDRMTGKRTPIGR